MSWYEPASGMPYIRPRPEAPRWEETAQWKKRSRCGMYLGQSLDHHNTVGKILNFQTGFVSPQFHCAYDELFTSCFGTVTDTVFDKEHWDSMLQFSGNHASHEDPVSPDPARRKQIARTQQDLFDIFRHPDHVTPPPPPVPEEMGPFCLCKLVVVKELPTMREMHAMTLRELQQMRERPTPPSHQDQHEDAGFNLLTSLTSARRNLQSAAQGEHWLLNSKKRRLTL